MKKLQFCVIASVFLIAFCIVVALFATYKVPYEPRQRLLVIIIGGFRYDYVTRDLSNLIGFPRMKSEGVKSEYVIPVFPSDSYPNWYSALTGLYPGNHGIVNSGFYNRETNIVEVEGVDPIWTQASRNGLNSSVYYLDGCQLNFQSGPAMSLDHEQQTSTTAINCQLKNNWTSEAIARTFTRTLYTIVDDFAKDKLSFSIIYYPLVDIMGHKYGPGSDQVYNAVRDIDLILYNLMNQLDRRGVKNSLNMYVFSDHGMSTVKKKVKLSNYVELNEVELSLGDHFSKGRGTFAMMRLKDMAATEKTVESLQAQQIDGLHVHSKEEIPEGFHIKEAPNLWPILIRASSHYYISVENGSSVPYEPKGYHGFYAEDEHQMRGVMYAVGPSFKRQYRGSAITQVDHYQLFCHILKIRAKPNNGSWSRVRDFIETY